jgi:hypothetical protein
MGLGSDADQRKCPIIMRSGRLFLIKVLYLVEYAIKQRHVTYFLHIDITIS